MAFTGRASATRGTLIRMKNTLKFIENGKNILKMKRDRLAGELNTLLNALALRDKLENELANVYTDYERSLALLGYATVSTIACSVSPMKIDVKPVSVMGVTLPKIRIEERPDKDQIMNMGLRQVATKLHNLADEMLHVAEIEASMERIAYELMMLNRKVNALEKIIIPDYEKLVKHVENLLFEEDLEDFSRIKQSRKIKVREEA